MLTVTYVTHFSTEAGARPVPNGSDVIPLAIDSGFLTVSGSGDDPVVVFSHVLMIPDAAWVRMYMTDTTLPKNADGTKSAFIRMTSVQDGAEQELDADGLARWRNSSAYFNGD